MSSVLSFTPRAASSHTGPAPTGGAAAIIIFPGVRYERVVDSAPVSPQPVAMQAPQSPRH